MDNETWTEQLLKGVETNITTSHRDDFWIDDFLHDHGIIDKGLIKMIQTGKQGDDRAAILISSLSPDEKPIPEVLIDIKNGKPSVEQVFDTTYDTSISCPKRIIAFENNENATDSNNPIADPEVVKSLIAHLNQYPLGLYLAEVNSNPFKMVLCDMTMIQPANLNDLLPISALPSPLQFRQAEFWNVYFASTMPEYQPLKSFSSGIPKTLDLGYDEDLEGIKVSLRWNEDGVFLIMKQIDDSYKFLFELFRQKEQVINGIYPVTGGDSICRTEKLPSLRIKVSKMPVSWLLTASSSEKRGHAALLQNRYMHLLMLIGDC